MPPAPVDPVDAMTPTTASDATAPAKKQRRRKNKQTKEADRETAMSEQTGTPEPDDEVEELPGEESKNTYIEIVQKRIRNLQKRKQRLDKYEEQAASPDAVKLNQDQLSALKSKDQVIYPLKELEELSKSFKTLDEEQKKQKVKDIKSHAAEIRVAVSQARKEALEEARERISVLVKFLHVASWKRQFASTAASESESAAFENLLSLIYAGDDAAVDAVYKLADGADELVDEGATAETSLTFNKIKQLSLESLDELYSKVQEEVVAEPVEDNIVIPKTEVDDEDDEEPISSVVKIPRGGISFLNESELDQEEENALAAPPPQTIADDVVTELAARPPAASQIDDSHANYAGATEWTENQPPVVQPAEPPAVPAAEPVWEQSAEPETPAATVHAPSKPAQQQQVLNNNNAGGGRGGRYRGHGHRGRGGGPNNANGTSGERRGGRGYYRGRGGRQNQNQQQQSSSQQQQITA
ncbi:hypothetical protein POJ06DRAFT_256974 [Lipomyces tetrasporus]|uniref:YAG7-like dimerisation domain-containing protein n=1 Tax=Lipomyces tetrasporus TaxID=54092 RepID=A0AAD7VRQ6_9ASCO|nr:uncharacterized protein POJ06DRAFT_256974 [Lipomyces tetrasporus]KAJ8099443.1 hypothetical protein POJ06DRAFT_256974 [Lipomyces tetrasporus]